uniref:MopE-related protein n=1 Tax=Hyunsoonleella ulvae TaxID=2799948 RepID=UPI00193A3D9C
NSSATEILYDGIDNDCNPETLDTVDADGDGENSDTDCDDTDPAVNSSATEILYDGIDNDCNPETPDTVDADGDGENSDTDCDDTDPAVNSSATEILGNGIDDDCNPETPDIIEPSAFVWTGTADSDWTNANNWANNNAPGLTPTNNVTIPNVGSNNYPILTADLNLEEGLNLSIESGASLTINPNTVLSNNGTVTNNGTLTLKSDATGSAYIGSGTGTFVGDATIERYIPAKRAYRQLASPVTTSTPIAENWQLGTHITGSNSGANGFDATNSGNSSMFIFDNEAYSYVPMANTNATNLIPGTMYHILVRGDRNTDLTNNNATPTETTLIATGKLTAENEGSSTITVDVPEQRFIAIGNPFQAPVNMNTVLTTNTTNIGSTFYWVWDPTLGSRGAYTAIIAATGDASSVDSDANQFLQAGQAGWVSTLGSGSSSINFTQNSKATSESETLVFKNSAQKASAGELRLSLYESNALAANESATDGVLILFDTNGNNDVDIQDAVKFTNLDENFATNNNGVLLSIENRAVPQNEEEIQLEINTYRNTNYTIVAEGSSIQGVTTYLVDNFTNIPTEVPQSGNVEYEYTVDSDTPGSIAADRFKIVFASESTLSVDKLNLEQISLYPNPTSIGKFYLDIPLGMDDLDVTIYNAIGAKLYTRTGLVRGTKATINTSFTQNQGIYFVKLTSKGKTVTKKLNIN